MFPQLLGKAQEIRQSSIPLSPPDVNLIRSDRPIRLIPRISLGNKDLELITEKGHLDATKRRYCHRSVKCIGRATASLFLASGARVALIGRRKHRLEEAAAAYLESGAAVALQADLSDEQQTEGAFLAAVDWLGRLDVLVNAAGILKSGDIAATTMALWDQAMNINLRSVFHLMKLAVPYLQESRGNIVNVSSVTGLRLLREQSWA